MWFISKLCFSMFLVQFVSISEKWTSSAVEAQSYSDNQGENNEDSNKTGSISRAQQALNIIDRLLQNYDARLRPHVEMGQPENITVSLIIQSISSVSETDMDFTVNMHFLQTWTDPRLAYGKFMDLEKKNGEAGGHSRMHVDVVESVLFEPDRKNRLWEPDTFFANERTSSIHQGPKVPNEGWIIYPDGTIFKSTFLTLTSTCPMKLAFFPMDHQICSIEIMSHHFQTKELLYSWAPFEKNSLFENKRDTLPFFKIVGQRLTTTTIKHDTQNKHEASRRYSLLIKEIMFARSLSYYLIQVYIPATMISHITLIPLWLDPVHSIAERIAIGVTIILTLSTFISGATQIFPTASYVKSIDLFTGNCFSFALFVLLENVIVIWVTKQDRIESESKSDAGSESKGFLTRNKNTNDENHDFGISSTISESTTKTTNYQNGAANSNDISKNSGMTPEGVDRKARVILPFLFWMHNIIHFSYYLTVSRVDTSEFI